MKKILVISIILLWAYPLFAATYYVRPLGGTYGAEDGSDYDNAWDGFVDIVWGSLGGGDTLYVCGTHNETLTVGASGSGVGTELLIRGDYSGDAGTIDKNDDAVNKRGLIIDGDDYVKVLSLTVTDCYSDGIFLSNGTTYCILDSVTSSYGGGDCIDINGSGTHHNTVTNCTMHHGGAGAEGGGGGININSAAYSNTVEYSESYSNAEDGFAFAGYPDCGTSTVAGDDNVLQYCYAHDNDEDGFDIKGNSGNIVQYCLLDNNGHVSNGNGGVIWGLADQNIIRYNWFEDNNRAFEIYQECGTGESESDKTMGHKIYGNIFKGNGLVANQDDCSNACWDNSVKFYNNTWYVTASAVVWPARDGPWEWKNNIIVLTSSGNEILQFSADGSDTNLVLDYNIYYNSNGSSEDAVNLSSGTSDPYTVAEVADGTLCSEKGLECHGGSTGLGEDPLMNNPGGDDFTLKGDSPCIGTGADLSVHFTQILHPKTTKTDFGTAGTVVLIDVSGNYPIGAYGFPSKSTGIEATGIQIQ